MGFDGNGNWTSPFYPVQDRDNGIAILASKFQELIQTNLKESFENCITRDGAGRPITNINWNGNKITNLQNGTSSADAVNKSQLDAVDTAKVAKSGDTMTGDLTISKSDASLKLINDNSVEYDIVSNDNGNFELVPAAGAGKKVYLNASDDYKPYYTDGVHDHRLLNVVESYTNGTSWYRVWDDGWCEQGGLSENIPSSSGGLTINFLVEMADTNYSVFGGVMPEASISGDSRLFCINRTTQKMELDWTDYAYTDKTWWEVKGYKA